MPNNSEIFEKRYKQNREQGKNGWSTEESYSNAAKNIDRILSAGYVKNIGKVLELGCGAGNNLIYLAKKGFEVYGIDHSEEAISWAKEKTGKENVKAGLSVGDAALLKDFKDSFFDFVFDGGVSYYVCGKARKTFFDNINRVLKPGGFCYIAAQHSDEKPKVEITKGSFRWSPKEGTFYRDGKEWASYRLSKEIIEEVTSARFKIVNIKKGKDEHPEDPFACGGELAIDCIKN
ncbi:MAG: hypothetical protein A2231_02645 [Candidatus Firestonebacteria bacterium RIFOXYA2_FULL_40_8]|nr:MAG: hypothetical protein A2231_02645 [Candidatus Firestonebacteria bacterium RIFOXYA2_FULL_40_8]